MCLLKKYKKFPKTSKHGGGTIEKCLKITQKHSKIIVLSAGLSPRPLTVQIASNQRHRDKFATAVRGTNRSLSLKAYNLVGY